jgi:hypothetical protein
VRRAALWLLTFLFALRVAGQAIQRWAPQAWLPPFDAFQGSELPYGVLLGSQLVILAAMARFAVRVPRPRRVFLWTGGIYMAGALARIAIGILVPAAPAWFSAWIPAFFHVVLAAYLLTLAGVCASACKADS